MLTWNKEAFLNGFAGVVTGALFLFLIAVIIGLGMRACSDQEKAYKTTAFVLGCTQNYPGDVARREFCKEQAKRYINGETK